MSDRASPLVCSSSSLFSSSFYLHYGARVGRLTDWCHFPSAETNSWTHSSCRQGGNLRKLQLFQAEHPALCLKATACLCWSVDVFTDDPRLRPSERTPPHAALICLTVLTKYGWRKEALWIDFSEPSLRFIQVQSPTEPAPLVLSRYVQGSCLFFYIRLKLSCSPTIHSQTVNYIITCL